MKSALIGIVCMKVHVLTFSSVLQQFIIIFILCILFKGDSFS